MSASGIERVMAVAYDAAKAGDSAAAEAAFLRAAELAPQWSVPWYELGLLCKYQCRWEESWRYNAQATRLDASDQSAWWNLGIAATALRDWGAARAAWGQCGIPLPPGDGAPDT